MLCIYFSLIQRNLSELFFDENVEFIKIICACTYDLGCWIPIIWADKNNNTQFHSFTLRKHTEYIQNWKKMDFTRTLTQLINQFHDSSLAASIRIACAFWRQIKTSRKIVHVKYFHSIWVKCWIVLCLSAFSVWVDVSWCERCQAHTWTLVWEALFYL